MSSDLSIIFMVLDQFIVTRFADKCLITMFSNRHNLYKSFASSNLFLNDNMSLASREIAEFYVRNDTRSYERLPKAIL